MEINEQDRPILARYVRECLDLMVKETGGEFPVMSSVLVKSGIANRGQLDILEEQGHIKSITIEVPSILVPSKTVPEKAYYTEYTENVVPKLINIMTYGEPAGTKLV
jgi:hypothetical protein